MGYNIKDTINNLVVSYINSMGDSGKAIVHESLQVLLNGNYLKYDLEKQISEFLRQDDLQTTLSTLNEKTDIRKLNGVFYTPEDAARYIVWNSITMLIDPANKRTYKEKDALHFIKQQNEDTINKLLFQTSFIDPTCGTGEFVLSVLKIKLDILKALKSGHTDNDIIKISKTLYGNDIDDCSTDIAKIRLFIEFTKNLKSEKTFKKVAEILFGQFYNKDFIVYNDDINIKFDCVVGNPPYVEYGKFPNSRMLKNGYGNIYADAIKNSFSILKDNGVLGFVIPLSYVATARMSRIRNYVCENSDREFVLSFADRPDCLFSGVHQKLNILIARKSKKEHVLFTSNYKHWYKEERAELLNGYEIKRNTHNTNLFIPKIGNALEESIYRKINTATSENIYDRQNANGKSLYLNMRACFWIKAFSFNPGSKEYKEFKFANAEYSFAHCVLNSSLFWIYWTMSSDCWHITSKELKGFLMSATDKRLCEGFSVLSKQLEEELENTKKYVGSKQTDYEYKHKECKKTIDAIDDALAELYSLTREEITYVKNYALKYRLGSGANDKSN